VIVNYDLLSKHRAALEAFPWTGLVFDEAHYLKNHTSQRSKLARALVDGAPNAVLHALTGTPLTNRPRDLFPLLQLVGHPMGKSFLSFAKRYCEAFHNGYGWVTDGASNLDELRIQLHGVMLRRTKDEVLDLPPKLRTWVPVSVPEETARKETRRVLDMLLTPPNEREPGHDHIRLLAAITRARQQIASAKVANTIEFLDGVVAQGEKVIVFSGFEDPVVRIAEHFGERAVLLTGSTPSAKRQQLVDRFQNDETVSVFVANLLAGGVGLNLTAARQVVFNDLDWVPANHWQAEDRAYRIGQHQTVNVTYFAAEGTIDEFIARTLAV
jgi:SWI/SNF-related matrix-associated actin-dependent regulator 1 of chromatin subfamily A